MHPRDSVDPVKLRLEDPEKEVEAYKYSMENYLSKCVDKYCEMAAFPRERMPAVARPFEDEAKEPRGCVESDEMASTIAVEAGKRSKRGSPTLATDAPTVRKDDGAPSTGCSATQQVERLERALEEQRVASDAAQGAVAAAARRHVEEQRL